MCVVSFVRNDCNRNSWEIFEKTSSGGWPSIGNHLSPLPGFVPLSLKNLMPDGPGFEPHSGVEKV